MNILEDNNSHWKWNLFLMWSSQLLVLAGFAAMMPFIPLFLKDELGIADERIRGVYMAAFYFFGTLGYALFCPIWGALSDRFGVKPMLLRGTFGTAILFPFRVKAKIHIEGSSEGKKSFGRKKRAENSLSVSTVYIDSDSMTPSHIENSIGSCSVYFEKTECYVGGGCITVENNLGSMQINVPAEWIAECETENNLGSVSVAETKNSTGPVINISIENNLGSVSVRYV